MQQTGPRRDLLPPGTSPVLVALLVVEIVAVVAALALGVTPARLLPAAVPVLGLTAALLNPAVEDLVRRRPALTVSAREADDEARVVAPRPSPWPVDVGRVLHNEVAVARSTANAHEGFVTSFLRLGGALGQEPTAEDHEKAQTTFERGVETFEDECSRWLLAYVAACEGRSRTFEVSLTVTNAGAHAENVKVDLELADSVTVTDDYWRVPVPPKRPEYKRPRPRMVFIEGDVGALVPDNRYPTSGLELSGTTAAREQDGVVGIEVGDVENGRTVTAGRTLRLLANGAGEHTIRWTAYTKSGRRPTTGSLTLVVPREAERPAIGRMQGILAFPDVPLGDGSTYPVRSTDPPPKPSATTSADDIQGRLRLSHAVTRWEQFGLDPATDEPA